MRVNNLSYSIDLDQIFIGIKDDFIERFNGWIDELRFSIGVALYTEPFFVVPSLPFTLQDVEPSPTPTPTPTPQGVFFQGVDLAENNMVSNPPAGFLPGSIKFGEVLGDESTDGTGMKVVLNPGQGLLLFSLVPIESPGLMEISSRIKTINAEPMGSNGMPSYGYW